jgi:hypothetical protein
MKSVVTTVCVFCFSVLSHVGFVLAQQQQSLPPQEAAETILIRLIAPAENKEAIGKKPDIKVEFVGQLDNLLVMLDGTDVTQLVKKTENGFTYKPIINLGPGAHTLKVTAKDKEGKDVQKEFKFQTKHYTHFDEASSNNQISVISETLLGKPGYDDTTPYRKVEGNIQSDNKLKKDEWEATLNTNVRYLELSELPQDPQKRGFDVANWTFTSAFTKEATKIKASLGDVSVTETPYTVSGLSRKGTVFEAEYDDRYQMRAFTMASQQSFGVDGGIGTDGSLDNHIFGVSLGAKFFDKKMGIKAIYVNGGEQQQNTYGTTTTAGQKKGDVFGFLVTSNFFQDKLKTEMEAAFSNFNPDDGTDGVGPRKDSAYRLKAEGVQGRYNYGGSYELIGRDFATIGNQGAEKDKQRATFTNGLRFDTQAINLTLLRANDNVRNDALFARTTDYNGNLVYSYTGIKNMPISFNYVKDQQKSSGGDPALKIDRDTDTLSGSISYVLDKWSFGFSPAFSYANDKTQADADTQTTTYTFTPAYNGETFSTSSSLSLNRTMTTVPRIWTDTYTVGLNLKKFFFNKKLVFDTANTLAKTKADDGSSDMRTLNLTGTLTYSMKDYFKGGLDPSVALKSSYMKIIDKVNSDNEKEEIRIFLVVTVAAPFIF